MALIETVEMICEGQMVKVNADRVEECLALGYTMPEAEDAPKKRGRPAKPKAEDAEG